MPESTSPNPAADEALSAVMSGELWSEFCDQLKATGQQILREEAPGDPLHRAEGWRYLTRLTRIALDMFVECADGDFPSFYRPSHETAKIGADNPDNYYQRAEINGAYDYRITGTRGSVAYLGFIAIAGGYEEEDGNMRSVGALDTHSGLEVDANGNIEIILSRQPHEGNWLPITENTVAVLVRQTYLDRKTERAAELKIERLHRNGAKPAPLDPVTFARQLRSTAAFVKGTATLFADWAEGFKQHPNTLPAADQEYCQKLGGDPNIYYYHGYFNLADDEALVIEADEIPDCDNWNFQLNNYWMESLEYRYVDIHVNKHTAKYRPDGGVRIVVSARDPGCDNWLDTTGHREGTMAFRWIGADRIVDPRCRVVKLSELS
ncbi:MULTISPECIES: DUF1214 domain-containing protein [Spongiibacter]|uniref:DUF1214 domain-containing protein n=2 Tax=Spongiibacteraceae TaxID=1706375 RepID=UPI000C437382|nr:MULTISPECIES: DUF1214 domain-containing protein [Spongiibacter]MAY38214.1 hypothetical protein [Spongiibacter sp.]|tara:strand:- start:21917 stop:23050 length:1134 start_codon:yes stop_codon:yes gene_type:complete